MPALKCLPVLEITSTRASPVLWMCESAASSSRQKAGCMVFIASGRFSTRWAMCPLVVRVKQVREGGVETFMPPL
jgi:hypothetical protein